MTTISSPINDLAARGVAFAPAITRAAARHHLDPTLLAAVAAQETGGPDTNAGSNIVGDGGHGHGVFQIDDRYHAFAQTPAAMNPAANADYAATMIRGLLDRNGGDVHAALSSYNAGSPHARGTTTRWADGALLGYADSVLRHYDRLGRGPQSASVPASQQSDSVPPFDPEALLAETIAQGPTSSGSVNALSDFHQRSYRDLAHLDQSAAGEGDALASLIAGDYGS